MRETLERIEKLVEQRVGHRYRHGWILLDSKADHEKPAARAANSRKFDGPVPPDEMGRHIRLEHGTIHGRMTYDEHEVLHRQRRPSKYPHRHVGAEGRADDSLERFQSLLDETRYDVSPLGTGKNWVTKLGGLPLMVRAVAHALIRSGHSESSAIATAIAALRRWAAGGGDVHPSTRARAAAAIAHFDAMKAASHATRSDDETFIEYLVEREAAKQRRALAILERRA